MIDRELAIQQALQLGLDRTPGVLMELEAARRDVLARAWANRVARQAGEPDESAAARYYREHPHLFAERRIYHLREATLGAGEALYPEARERLLRGDPLPDVLAWLHEQGTRLKDQVVVRAAEQLPIEALPRLATTPLGRSAYFETPRGLMIYEVIDVNAAPLDWQAAQPVIRRHLARQAGKQAVVAEKQRLRREAEVERLWSFTLDDPGPAEEPM